MDRASGIWAVDVTARRAADPTSLAVPDPDSRAVLGWAAERKAVLLDHTQSDRTRVVALLLGGGGSRELTRTDTSNYGVGRLQLASALLGDLTVRAPGDVDRGPAPLVTSAVLALLARLGAMIAASWIGRRRQRARPTRG